MLLSPFLRLNGFSIILWADKTSGYVFSVLYVTLLHIHQDCVRGTDGLQLLWNESNASQFMSMKRRYVGMQNALSMVSVHWRTASWMELDKLSVGSSSLVTQHQHKEKPIPFDMSTQNWILAYSIKTGAWHVSAMCYSLNYYLASNSFIPHYVCGWIAFWGDLF